MTLASTNRVQLSYIPEATFGVTPTTGNGKKLRMTGETLDFGVTKSGDKEIRSDRQEVSSTTTDSTTQGDIKTHMQFAEYDPLLLAVLQTTDAASMYGTDGVSSTFTSTISATTITAGAAPTGANAFTNLKKGQWFKLNAPADPNDGKWLRVSTITAPTSTIITLDTSTPCVTGGVALSSIAAYRMTNGVVQPSFSLERSINDITTPLFYTYKGMTVSKFACSFASAALTEPTFSFMGSKAIQSTAKVVPGTLVSSKTFDIQNGVTGVNNVWENGAPLTSTYIKKLDLSIDNSLRAQKALGNLGTVGIGSGTLKVSGSMDLYLADGAMYTKFLADTYTSLVVSTQDAAGNGYVFSLPKVMITKCTITAGSKDADMMLAITWEAKADTTNADATLQQTIFIDRLGVANTISFA